MSPWTYPLCVLDLETTGFPGQSWTEVIEVGLVVIAADGSCLTHSTLVRPEGPLGPEVDGALKVNNITREMLWGAPDREGTVEALLSGFKTLQVAQLAAFGNAFDQTMLTRFCGPRHVELPPWGPCIKTAAGQAIGKGNPSLVKAAAWAGAAWDGPPHRALPDAMVAWRVLQAIERLSVETTP